MNCITLSSQYVIRIYLPVFLEGHPESRRAAVEKPGAEFHHDSDVPHPLELKGFLWQQPGRDKAHTGGPTATSQRL